jgi:hypothetical protein
MHLFRKAQTQDEIANAHTVTPLDVPYETATLGLS